MTTTQAVAGIPARPPRYSLLIAADVVESAEVPPGGLEQPDAERWTQGITWAPETLAAGGSFEPECEGDGQPEIGEGDPVQVATPFVVYSWDVCSAMAVDSRDYVGRALRGLAGSQSWMVARNFQQGVGSNVGLVDGTDLGSFGIAECFGRLEGAIGDRLQGRRAMIHCPPFMFAFAKANNLIYLEQQKWVTAQGTIVVCDAGYMQDSGHMYATSMVKVFLSPVLVIPESYNESLREAMDRSVNDITIYAERLALVQFDSGDEADAVFKIALD